MRWKSPTALAGLTLGLATLCYLLWFLFSEDALLREVSRADVPGTNLTVVVYKDEKNLTRYRMYADGEKATKEARIFGGMGYGKIQPVIIERDRERIRMVWNSESGPAFIEFDLLTCQIVRDSNGSGAVPHTERCRRLD